MDERAMIVDGAHSLRDRDVDGDGEGGGGWLRPVSGFREMAVEAMGVVKGASGRVALLDAGLVVERKDVREVLWEPVRY